VPYTVPEFPSRTKA